MTPERGLDESIPKAALPRQLADFMRPEMGSVAAEIIEEIMTTIPVYMRPLDGPYGMVIKTGVEDAVSLFIRQIVEPDVDRAESYEVHRALGRNEMRAGRSLETLQAAYRVAARVSWRRIMDLGRRSGLSSAVMSQLADSLLAFLDEMVSVAVDGYMEAKACSADVLDTWRRRLLQMILETPPAPATAIAELASLIGWVVPGFVTPIAVRWETGLARPRLPTRLDVDVLAELDGSKPVLLVSGEVNEARLAALRGALPGCQLSVGPCVPLEEVADSLRWARQAITLGEQGLLPRVRLIRTDEQLSTLLLHSDTRLVDRLRQRLFAPIAEQTEKQRTRILETLRAWLAEQGNVLGVATRLNVHPQTVRYRMRLLQTAFGANLEDPAARFEMELVLRADEHQWQPDEPVLLSSGHGVTSALWGKPSWEIPL